MRFSAWPYVNADAVWRALLDAIARKVYGVGQTPPVTAKPPESTRARLRRLSMSEVVAAPATESNGAPSQKYERLMQQLGRATALATRNTQDAETARQVSLLAGLLVDVVSSVAAPVAPLRRVLGLESESFGSPSRRTSLAEQTVVSVEEARSAVRELFADATTPRTMIIVDDLDRCMPEVALDVLETIKISYPRAPRLALAVHSSSRLTSRCLPGPCTRGLAPMTRSRRAHTWRR